MDDDGDGAGGGGCGARGWLVPMSVVVVVVVRGLLDVVAEGKLVLRGSEGQGKGGVTR